MATNQSEYAVHASDKDGNAVVVLPGEEIPAGVKITNPYVLGTAPDPAVVEHDDDDDGEPGDGPPPQSGTGSGVKVWRFYAESHGVNPEGLERDEIIAALEAAGVPVE